MLSQSILASGSRKSPLQVSIYHKSTPDSRHTFSKAWNKAMGLSIHETTLSCHADGRQDVVTGHHYCPNVGVKKLLNDSCSCGLELVLKNNEANKVKVALDFTSGHFLSLDPAELLKMTASNTNYTITLVSVPRQKLVIILGDYRVLVNVPLDPWPGYLQLSGRHISFIASGAPLTKMSPLFWPNCRTITLARRRLETNSNVFCTPSSTLDCSMSVIVLPLGSGEGAYIRGSCNRGRESPLLLIFVRNGLLSFLI